MVALSELLALISIVFGFLPKHNSENKILIRYHIVWLLVDYQSKGSKRRDARLSKRSEEDKIMGRCP